MISSSLASPTSSSTHAAASSSNLESHILIPLFSVIGFILLSLIVFVVFRLIKYERKRRSNPLKRNTLITQEMVDAARSISTYSVMKPGNVSGD